MAITRVGATSATGTTASLPAGVQAGDLIVVVAWRNNSTSAPAVPAGYAAYGPIAGPTCSMVAGIKLASGPSDTVGTWSPATGVVVHVYRGGIGILGISNTGTSALMGFISSSVLSPNSSWVMRVGAHRTATNLVNGDLSDRYEFVTGVTNQLVSYDTAGPITSGSTGANNQAVNASSGWITLTIEIVEAGQDISTGLVDTFDEAFTLEDITTLAKWRKAVGTGESYARMHQGYLDTYADGTLNGTTVVWSQSHYSVQGTRCYVRPRSMNGGQPLWGLQESEADLSRGAYWGWSGLGMFAGYGQWTQVRFGFNNLDVRFSSGIALGIAPPLLSIRESGGTVYWEYSSDSGATWTEVGSAPTATVFPEWSGRRVKAVIGVGRQTSGDAGLSRWDNFNTTQTFTRGLKAKDFSDPFNEPTLNPDRWLQYPNSEPVAIIDGELQITGGSGVYSTALDMDEGELRFQVTKASWGGELFSEVFVSLAGALLSPPLIVFDMNSMTARVQFDVTEDYVGPFDYVEGDWFRFREVSNTLYIEQSSDGHEWTTLGSTTLAYVIANLSRTRLWIIPFTDGPVDFRLDNFNASGSAGQFFFLF
ncbi:hypothetical protein SEA_PHRAPPUCCINO_177 [Mycobacterium phage Phrappuccino]|uniref:Uncharacterized protein n=1 Tax=Mycobacterium phage Phrappuccino TaxID=2591223 RepID=A0A514DE14_9CAUD|nr:hypothetical protein KHQ87_gp177 [Mycobacterium phage Phrappuccino]QDH91852.1 hypothetical protein SEA_PHRAPPUCCINO_177 [Mycobacterium phage Phrappuccino]QIQ63293.1 hypothetical protein SEA_SETTECANDELA_177 [Mycobacterium phage Settecandela]